MDSIQRKKYQSLYQQHVNALYRQGKAATTTDVYSRAVRRITKFFDCSPDKVNQDHLKDYFSAQVKSHSWSTVKVDRKGLQFFYKQAWISEIICSIIYVHVNCGWVALDDKEVSTGKFDLYIW